MEKILRVAIALATALLCSISLYDSGVSQAANPVGATGAKCFSYKAPGVSSTVCNYGFEQPFLLNGYSRGGSSTLSYTVKCGTYTTWPVRRAAADRRVWYRRSIKVSGNFKVYGAKGAVRAASHCRPARGEAALLTVKLKMSKRVTRTNLVVRIENSLPWGRQPALFPARGPGPRSVLVLM